MVVDTTPQVRYYTPAEAAAEVQRLKEKMERLFEERFFRHVFMRELEAGELPVIKLQGWLRNWYRFALEINAVQAEAYNRYLGFFERHPDCYDVVTEKIADELIHPGPGGHVKLLYILGEALGISQQELVEASLIPEARALVDVRVRLYREGPIAEAYASSLIEGKVGFWMGTMYNALTTHYGITPQQACYFSTHLEADTQEHERGLMGHGEANAYLLRQILQSGYRPERPSFNLEYVVEFIPELYAIFLDGVYKRHEAKG